MFATRKARLNPAAISRTVKSDQLPRRMSDQVGSFALSARHISQMESVPQRIAPIDGMYFILILETKLLIEILISYSTVDLLQQHYTMVRIVSHDITQR